ERHPALRADAHWALEIAYNEILLREELGEAPQVEEYVRRFPHLAGQLEALFEVHRAIGPGHPVDIHEALTVAAGPALETAGAAPAGLPVRLGRYRVIAQVGSGAFGTVFRAYDADLQREVAIKVPHRHCLTSLEGADDYLAEARLLASLDHPGIVPVYDVGQAEGGGCYLVSKFIVGSDRAVRIRRARPSHAESAEIVARVAEALHHAHQRGLIHRDVKPANILLDLEGRPVVADFGLALREAEAGRSWSFAGTP